MHTTPAQVGSWVAVLFIAAVAVVVLYKMVTSPGTISLDGLLSEPAGPPPAAPGAAPPVPAGPAGPVAATAGKASLSRLQLLLFTFAIIGLYVTLCLEAGMMVELPNQVLGLLGISGGSYVLSKGIQANAGNN
jgi:hypothetical protein